MQKDKGITPAIILAVIVLVTTTLLAVTSGLTAEARALQAESAANQNRQTLFPAATVFEPIDLTAYLSEFPTVTGAFAVRDGSGAMTGLIYQCARRGYSGDVPVMVAIGLDNKVNRILVLANDETPGLGKKVEADGFLKQYSGLDVTMIYTVKANDPGKVKLDAIAGATISSRAVTMAVNDACALHQKLVLEVK